MHADRGDLARRARQPDAGEPLDSLGGEVERHAGANQRLLEVAHVLLHVAPVPFQVEDRIADELTGAVKRRLAAAVRLDDLDLRVRRHMQLGALVGAAPKRHDRRMLE